MKNYHRIRIILSLLIIAFFFLNQSIAQNNKYLKQSYLQVNLGYYHKIMNTSFDHYSLSSTMRFYEEIEVKSQVGFGLGYRVKKPKNWYQLFALNLVNFERLERVEYVLIPNEEIMEPRTGQDLTIVNVWLRYEIGKQLSRSKDSRLLPFAGIAFDPYVNYLDMKPKTSQTFPINFGQYGARLNLMLGMEYALNKKWSIAVKTPVELVNLFYEFFELEHPGIVQSESLQNSFETDLGLKINEVNFSLSYCFGE